MPLRQSLDDTIIRLKEEIRGIEMEIMGQRISEMAQTKRGLSRKKVLFGGDPFGARTQDPNIKSVVLYQLS